MKILGLIVEYNPFHNGHILHINKSKELVNPDITIAIMSSSFMQRGDIAVIDKWKRSKIALEYGVDIVIELPLVYSLQSADYFAYGAIKLLNEIGVSDICFGSECGDINIFYDIARAIKDNNELYNEIVKRKMNEGYRYPNACNEALKIIMNKEIRTPNDLLGLSYVKEIVFNEYPIKAHCITRTNSYHDNTLQSIASAKAIRTAINNHDNYHDYLPHSQFYSNINTLNKLFPYLKYHILLSTPNELKTYHLVDEGIENKLIEEITKHDNIEDYVESLTSKRYTRARIQRMLIHILLKNTKEDIKEAMNIDYIRILAMNDKGREYLNIIKKDINYKIVTNYPKHKHLALDIELKASKLLSLVSNEDLINQEYYNIPYKK